MLRIAITLTGGALSDGRFGNRTEAAVRVLQVRNGLTGDGIVGTSTWKLLDKTPVTGVTAKRTPPPGQPGSFDPPRSPGIVHGLDSTNRVGN